MNNRRSFLKLLPLLAVGMIAPRAFSATPVGEDSKTTPKPKVKKTAVKQPTAKTTAKKPSTKPTVKKTTVETTEKKKPAQTAAKKPTKQPAAKETSKTKPQAAPKPAPIRVKESDPPAAAIGYRHDTAQVDSAKYPAHEATQICGNCVLYQPTPGTGWGTCGALRNYQVNAGGWCKIYVRKAEA